MIGNLEILDDAIRRLESVEDEMIDIVFDVSDKFLDLMAQLNREQLQKGENPEGRQLVSIRPYTPATIAAKRAKGQPYNKVTLFDEGHLYARLKAKKYEGYIEITTDVPQTDELIRKWGEFEGLSEVHIELVSEMMEQYVIEETRKRLKI